jgi:lysozyme
MRIINREALDLIKQSENDSDPKSGYRKHNGVVSYVPYADEGRGVPTIGYGTIKYPDGTAVKLSDDAISEDQAVAYLLFELKDKSAQVEKWAIKNNIKLTDNQFSALVSFSYNEGCSYLLIAGHSLHDAVTSGGEKEIRAAFALYNKAGGKVLPGLVIRRKKEADLYFKS